MGRVWRRRNSPLAKTPRHAVRMSDETARAACAPSRARSAHRTRCYDTPRTESFPTPPPQTTPPLPVSGTSRALRRRRGCTADAEVRLRWLLVYLRRGGLTSNDWCTPFSCGVDPPRQWAREDGGEDPCGLACRPRRLSAPSVLTHYISASSVRGPVGRDMAALCWGVGDCQRGVARGGFAA